LRDRADAEPRVDGKRARLSRQRGDVGEILARIIGELAEQQRIDRERPRNAESQHVAVGLGLGDRVGAEIAARTGLVLHHK